MSSSISHSVELHNLDGSSRDWTSKGKNLNSLKDPEDVEINDNVEDQLADTHQIEVKRSLKRRHVVMIALGGTIGTGLFIGISTPLRVAGPVNALIAYLFMATLVYSVTQSLGEMATLIPVTSSFTVFAKRFVSPAFGVAVGYIYWFSWAMTFALELSIIGQVIGFWSDAVPEAAWIAIFWVIFTVLNLFPVKLYGEIEFWFASLKVLAIMGFIIYAFIMVCGAGVTGPVGFRYWRNPGAWGPGYIFEGTAKGRFLGFVSSLTNAAFTYQGTELAGITAGESKNPRKAVPKAIRTVFLRILLFYILSLFFLGLLVPYNDPKLESDTSYVASSPFIIAIQNSGTKVLPDIFNAVVLLTILSAANSNVYIASRISYSMAINKTAPKWFKYTTKGGVPYVSVIFAAMFGNLAYMAVSQGATTVFNWLLNITTVAGLFTWFAISFSHVRFMQTLKSRGMSRDDLPFKAAWMPGLAYYSCFWMIVIILIQGYECFVGDFDVELFFVAYVSVILFFALWIGFQLYYRTRIILKLDDIDIDTDRREIDDIYWEEDDESPKNLWEKFWNIVA